MLKILLISYKNRMKDNNFECNLKIITIQHEKKSKNYKEAE